MGRKIFISYKYGDESVSKLNEYYYEMVNGHLKFNQRKTRVRDYVNKLQNILGRENINLGEKDGESLELFSDSHIESELKRRIRQCSVTIVLISKGMKEQGKPERDQWIPWEVSYSLRTVPTGGNTKQMNAILGVILPDENGTYDWYYTENPACNSITHHIDQLFNILKRHMFNRKVKETRECSDNIIEEGSFSFIQTVKWHTFLSDYFSYIEKSIEIRDKEHLYKIEINI